MTKTIDIDTTTTTTTARAPRRISAKVLRGAELVGADKHPRGWTYYADEIRAYVLVSSRSLALAAEMEEDGEWDMSEWCANTTARELRRR